jgi:membrane-bound inhibitor of C-type lysozyme
MKKLLYVVVAVVVLVAAYYFFGSPVMGELKYACANGGDLTVRVKEGKAVIQSDSATIVREELSQVESASGAKYENKDFVYWSKGTEATVWEDGKVILASCVL